VRAVAVPEKVLVKRPKQSMPSFVRAALNKRGLMEVYKGRPAYQKNDYLAWIKGAKLEKTREKRLRQMLSELKSGKTYMNMAWSGNRSRR
jgi:uncharacterized protein YdeI (YjbR/CyaY-like superfamily)